MAQLVLLSGPRAGETIQIDRDQVIGRGEADIVIEDPKLSRRHAVLRPTATGLEIEDLGSLNGTTVDGRAISAPVELRGGERIKLGATEIEVPVPPIEAGATVLEPAAEIDATLADAPVAPRPAAPPPPPPRAPAPPSAPEVPRGPGQAPPLAPSDAPAPPPPPAPFGAPPSGGPRAPGSPLPRPAASLLWVPTVLCVLVIIATAVAVVLYFKLRTPPP